MVLKKPVSFLFVPTVSWLVYVIAYLGRINLSIAIPFLQNEQGYSKAMLGVLASAFYGAYAVGQIINGTLGDRIRIRNFISLGLFVAGLSNIVFALFRSFPLMFLSWALNGYFQSMLWGPLLRGISASVPPAKHRQAMFLMSTSPVAGYFFAYILAGRLAAYWKWEAAFWVPGILLIAASAAWYLALPETSKGNKIQQPKNVVSLFGSWSAVKNFGIFVRQSKIYFLILLGVFVGIVKECFTLWAPAIFTELYKLDYTKMLSLMLFAPLANLGCVILAGLLVNKYLWNERYVIILFLFVGTVSIFLLWKIHAVIFVLIVILYYGLSSSIYTANIIMTGYLPLYYKSSGRVSAAAGITDCAIYLGAVIAGPFVGMAAEQFGWNGIFGGILVICAAALVSGFLVSIPLAICKGGTAERPRYQKQSST